MDNIHSENHAPSYYAATQNYQHSYPTLTQNISADICIIGGGFTGVATALELAERGYQVVLIEARKIAWGASGRNGGQMICGIGHDLSAFKQEIGQTGIDAIEQMAVEANQLIIDRVKKYQIDCDLTLGYCDLATRPKHLRALKAKYQAYIKQGYPHQLTLLNQSQVQKQVVNSQRYLGGLHDMGSGHLHPLNLCAGQAQTAHQLGVKIYENTPMVSIDYDQPHIVHTPTGQIKANTLVLAGNAYWQDKIPEIANKILPAGSYIIATEPLSDELALSLMPSNDAVCDLNIALDYFRLTADKRLLFGGICTYSARHPRDIKAALYPKMLKIFPQLNGVKIDYQWGGMIGIGMNRLPQIGQLKDDVYYAQAYAGHGVSASHIAGRIIAEHIAQESERINYFQQVKHYRFLGGRYLRSPLLAAGMMYHQLVDMITP